MVPIISWTHTCPALARRLMSVRLCSLDTTAIAGCLQQQLVHICSGAAANGFADLQLICQGRPLCCVKSIIHLQDTTHSSRHRSPATAESPATRGRRPPSP